MRNVEAGMPVRSATSLIVRTAGSKFGIGNLHLRRRNVALGVPDCDRNDTERSDMSTVEQSVEVEVPLRTAYDQWTQFEEFPRFMEGVESVRQLDDTHLHWTAESPARDGSGTPRSPSSGPTNASPGPR